MFNRIAIGTANWGQEYNGTKVDEEEVKKILDYCTCCGINTLDTAEEYGSEEVIGRLANSSFHIVTKGNGDIEKSLDTLDRPGVYGYLWRTPNTFGSFNIMDKAYKTGMSLYDVPDPGQKWMTKPKILQVPYSLMDRRFEHCMEYWHRTGIEIHARSVFLRGKCLEKSTPEECIAFALSNQNVDKVVIGADSSKQLKDNLDFIHKWNKMKCEDEEIIDPRKWKEAK